MHVHTVYLCTFIHMSLFGDLEPLFRDLCIYVHVVFMWVSLFGDLEPLFRDLCIYVHVVFMHVSLFGDLEHILIEEEFVFNFALFECITIR